MRALLVALKILSVFWFQRMLSHVNYLELQVILVIEGFMSVSKQFQKFSVIIFSLFFFFFFLFIYFILFHSVIFQPTESSAFLNIFLTCLFVLFLYILDFMIILSLASSSKLIASSKGSTAFSQFCKLWLPSWYFSSLGDLTGF